MLDRHTLRTSRGPRGGSDIGERVRIWARCSIVERSELFRAAIVDHLSDLVLTAAQAQRLLDDPRVRDVGLSTIEVRDEEE